MQRKAEIKAEYDKKVAANESNDEDDEGTLETIALSLHTILFLYKSTIINTKLTLLKQASNYPKYWQFLSPFLQAHKNSI